MPIKVKSVIKTRRGRRPNYVRERLNLAIDGAMDSILADLRKATGTWKRKPKFTARIRRTSRAWVTEVFTDDPRWEWISEGTKPYLIFPRKPGGRLRFGYPYSPATASNRLVAREAKVGGDVAYVSYVRHPGIKARNLNRRIARRHEKTFRVLVESALDVNFLDKSRSRRIGNAR